MMGVAGWPQSPVPRVGWTVAGLALFESQMGKDGSDYAVLARWP
jgi:2'-5' RNA ligase